MSLKDKVSSTPLADNKNSRRYWPWWRLEFRSGQLVLIGSTRAELSPHLVNLRAAAHISKAKVEPLPRLHGTPSGASLDFIGSKLVDSCSLLSLVTSLSRRPVAGSLSIVFVWEVMAWLADMVWLPLVQFFLQTYDQAMGIAWSIGQDVKTFVHLLKLILGYPWHRLGINRFINWRPKIHAISLVPVWQQTLAFFVFSLIIILPFKVIATWQDLTRQSQQLTDLAGSGFRELESASELLAAGNPELAQQQLANARLALAEASRIVNELNNELAGILNLLPIAAEKLSAARNLLAASQEITATAELVGRTLEQFNQPSAEPFSLSRSLRLISESSSLLKMHLLAAYDYLARVNEAELPADYNSKIFAVKNKLNSLKDSTANLLALPQLLEQLLFASGQNTYAIIFQNTSELRPTGGFAGSLALIEVTDGQISSVNIPGGGPYDFQGSLSRVIRPPEPLRLVRGTWQLQDANWFFDFPASAEKIAWFLQASGGPQVAGVMAINSNVVVDLLKLTGPLEMPEYGKVLTADNFMSETQAAVDIEYDRAQNRPKQFIADLAPRLFERLINLKGSDLIRLSALINASLLKRDIQLYAVNEALERQLKDYGWAGEVRETPDDYLAIVRANVGGGKTDKVMREKVDHRVEFAPTGELIVRLRVTRSHHGDPYDTFEQRPNVTYYRFYVPRGSTLLSTQGFTPPPATYYRPVPSEAEPDEQLEALEKEISWDNSSGTRITEEFNKTVFANWLIVAPGETKTAELTYRLPFRAEATATWQDLRRYSLLLQRQSGMSPVDLISEFIWPESFRLRWQESSRQTIIQPHSLQLHTDWQVDEQYGLILERR